jgi:hypothetical protein
MVDESLACEEVLKREAAQVYLLLDYLSGQSDRSLTRQISEQHPHDKSTDEPPPRPGRFAELAKRAMRLRYSPEREHFDEDAAFLLQTRDELSALAHPANCQSIAFTALVSAKSLDTQKKNATLEAAVQAFPEFSRLAGKLRRRIEVVKWVAWGLVVLVLLLSAYAAWGKLLLNNVDHIRGDFGALTGKVVNAELSGALPYVGPLPPDPLADEGQDIDGKDKVFWLLRDIRYQAEDLMRQTCRETVPLFRVSSRNADGSTAAELSPPSLTGAALCAELMGIRVRMQEVDHRFEGWTRPFYKILRLLGVDVPYKPEEQWGPALLAVLGNYILPMLYGCLGSMTFVLRRYYLRLGRSRLKPGDHSIYVTRIVLGVVVGACVGLFFTGSASDAQASGVLSQAIALSASAYAFLAGYAVDPVFRTLDALTLRVFGVSALDAEPMGSEAKEANPRRSR